MDLTPFRLFRLIVPDQTDRLRSITPICPFTNYFE